MVDAELHAKLDRLLAGQQEQDETAAAMLDGLNGLLGLLNTQTEMLASLLDAATAEPAEDGGIGKTLIDILAALKRIEDEMKARAPIGPEVRG